jgi:hypothetical protein
MLAGQDQFGLGHATAPAQVGLQLPQEPHEMRDLVALFGDVIVQMDGLAAAVEKLCADLVLDVLDAARKGRLRKVPPLCCLAERSRLGDGQDVFQPIKSHQRLQHAIFAYYFNNFEFDSLNDKE